VNRVKFENDLQFLSKRDLITEEVGSEGRLSTNRQVLVLIASRGIPGDYIPQHVDIILPKISFKDKQIFFCSILVTLFVTDRQ